MVSCETHKNGSNRALLVVDMIADFASKEGKAFVPGAPALLPMIFGELQYFRERLRPIIFACTELGPKSAFASKGSHGAKLVESLQPRPGEIVLKKVSPNSFFETDLTNILKRLSIARLSIVGLQTHTGVLFSAADAIASGVEVSVPETCVCSSQKKLHDFALTIIRKELVGWARL